MADPLEIIKSEPVLDKLEILKNKRKHAKLHFHRNLHFILLYLRIGMIVVSK